jgi:membrane protease YdiL (CAAX protease family)
MGASFARGICNGAVNVRRVVFMSIMPVLAQIDAHFLERVLWFTLLVVPISVAAMAHVFSPRKIIGPPRMEDNERVGPLWICMLVGLFVWMMVPATYSSARSKPANATTQQATTATSQAAFAPGFTPEETIAISAVTGVAVLASMMFANAAVRRGGLARLGFSARSLGMSAAPAVISILIIIPMMYVVSGATQWFWELIRLEHPEAHPFLETFASDGNPLIRALIVISAVFLAPAFEEMLFRGHLQTAVLYSLRRLVRDEMSPARGFEPVMSTDPSAPAVIIHPDPPTANAATAIAIRWIAIIFTSFIFALVHQQLWMMPPIFFLSLCLGYAYERTGNLWVPILIHATFNAVNVAVFWLRL